MLPLYGVPAEGLRCASRLPCARFAPLRLRAALGSPVYLKQECLRRLAAKTFCDWCFAPTAGGFAALATINDGASLLIEGEVASLTGLRGLDGRVVSATSDSVYTKQDTHLFN